MNRILKNIPMPMVGLMLSLAALGNLVQSYGQVYRTILGILATIIFAFTTVKFLWNFQDLKRELSNPIGASVFPTYSMGLMLLATYLLPYSYPIAYGIWVVAILLHTVLIIYFTATFVRNFNMIQVFPSWFVVYVGIAVAAVTCKAFNQIIGQWAFYFAFLSYLVLLPIIIKRVLFVKNIPEPALPTLIIFAAPGSLCLAGYISAFDTKYMVLIWFLLILSQGIYLLSILKLFQLLKLKFYPSYSGFAFPLVISAIAIKASNAFLISQGYAIKILSIFIRVEEIIAIIIVFYVFIRYLGYILKLSRKEG